MRDRLRRRGVAIVAVFIDLAGISRRQAGETEHLPRSLVAIAAVDRIGEEPVDRGGEQRLEERLGAHADELGFAFFHGLQCGNTLGRREAIEFLPVGLARPRIGGGDAGSKELLWGQGELVALLGLAFLEGTAAVHLGATAPGARQLTVAEGHASAIGTPWRKLVGRRER